MVSLPDSIDEGQDGNGEIVSVSNDDNNNRQMELIRTCRVFGDEILLQSISATVTSSICKNLTNGIPPVDEVIGQALILFHVEVSDEVVEEQATHPLNLLDQSTDNRHDIV
jgi:hypothetical protein